MDSCDKNRELKNPSAQIVDGELSRQIYRYDANEETATTTTTTTTEDNAAEEDNVDEIAGNLGRLWPGWKLKVMILMIMKKSFQIMRKQTETKQNEWSTTFLTLRSSSLLIPFPLYQTSSYLMLGIVKGH